MKISFAFLMLAEAPTLPPAAKYILIALGVAAAIALTARAVYVSRHREESVEEKTSDSPVPPPITVPAVRFEEDNGALVAAITAAIGQVLAAEGKDPRGFRVVSFKRSNKR